MHVDASFGSRKGFCPPIWFLFIKTNCSIPIYWQITNIRQRAAFEYKLNSNKPQKLYADFYR